MKPRGSWLYRAGLTKYDQLLRFIAVGATSAGAYAVIVATLIEGFSINRGTASSIAYALAIPFNYFGQRIFAFRSKANPKSEIVRYLGVHLINVAMAGALMTMSEALGISYLWGSLAVVLWIPLSSYILLNFFVFSR